MMNPARAGPKMRGARPDHGIEAHRVHQVRAVQEVREEGLAGRMIERLYAAV